MARGVSIAHARKIARNAPVGCSAAGTVGQDGRLRAELQVSVKDARLRCGRDQDVRAILYESGSADGNDPRPIPARDGRHAVAIPLAIHPRKDQTTASLRIDAPAPDCGGGQVDVVLERVRRPWAPIALATLAGCAALAVWLVAGWGDPAARRGHYEGKTTEEIQADLDTDVAWYAMEISVASHMTVPEGETRVEARIENVEANHCDQRVRIWETGGEDDVLYESGAIAPGEYLQYVELAHALPVGTHTLTVEFQGYEQTPTLVSDEGRILGHDTFGAACAAEVTLEVTARD